MNRGLKIGGLVVLILGAGVGAYFLFRKDEGDSPTPSPNGNKSSGSSKYKNNEFPLKKDSGDIGQSVKRVSALQRYLNDVGSYGLTVDGKFGPKTLNALKEEQSPFDNFKIAYPNAVHGEVNENYYNDQVKLYEDASYVAPTNFSGKGRGQVRSQNCSQANYDNCIGAGYNSCSQDGPDADADCYCSSDASGPAWGDCDSGRIKDIGKRTSFINANGTWFDDLEVGY
jgi:hypothetical protein